MSDRWITVKEAAELVGYSPAYFRDLFCNAERPLLTIRARDTGGRRGNIQVSEASVDALIRAQTRGPEQEGTC
jgi:urocanate hydratase